MKSDTTPLRYSHLWDTALDHAREIAAESGEAAIIYYRPIDDQWFVLRADAAAPPGLTIKTVVDSDSRDNAHHDLPEHALDGPARTDVHI
jgi:hypothetical protein